MVLERGGFAEAGRETMHVSSEVLLGWIDAATRIVVAVTVLAVTVIGAIMLIKNELRRLKS